MKSSLFDKINPNILSILKNNESPTRIIAAPGSGKTETITLKYLYLITECGVDPSNILLLTFSNKATTELKERIIKKLDIVNYNYNTEQLSISTIHSFCKKIIEDYSEYFINKFSATTVLNDISQGSFILSFIEDFGFRSKLDAASKVFDDFIPYFNMMADENLDSSLVYEHLKKQFYDLLEKYKKQKDSKDFDKEFNEIKNLIYFNSLYPIYLKKLVEKKYIDFSHLQKFLLEELQANPQLLELLQKKFQYILIDEFQDTSYLQAEIILKISAPFYKITVCGDDDQSLYRFRGATVSNFLDFPNKIPAKVFDYYLNINFRSCQNIVTRSAALIEHNNPFRIENKVIISNEKNPGIIKILKSDNPTSEASDLCIIIENLIKDKKIASYSDIAIFFRSVINDSGSFLQLLKEKKIPYKVFGIDKVDTSNILYSIIDCWKFACSYTDSLDLNSNNLIKLEEVELEYLNENGINSKTLKYLLNTTKYKDELFYIEHLLNLRTLLKNKEIKSNISFFYSITNINKYFHEAVDSENKEFLSDIAYLSRIVIEIDSAYQRTDPFLISKLFSLLSLKGEDEIVSASDSGALNIMTIHQAKGLEFPVVIMPNLVQPKTRANKFSMLNDLFHYESKDPLVLKTIDERKLFYVGITRAKDHLYLSYPSQVPWGKKHHKVKPLSYLSELNIAEQSIDQLVLEMPFYSQIREKRENDENDKLVLNFSKIQTYIECPRKYNYKYNLGFATILESQLYFGSTLHKCLEKIHKNYLTNKKTEYSLHELENLIDENWIEITHRKKETKELKNTALNYIFKYVVRNNGFFNQITYSEKKFSVFDKMLNFEINGIIDLVKTDYNGDTVIVDFKVSKIDHPTYLKQMHLYAFAYLKAFGVSPKKMQLYSLRESEIKDVDFTKKDIKNFTFFLSKTITDIRAENYLPNKGKHCSNCPYYNFCHTT